ncbi:hypothetical protein PanWU01x14_352920 [Parasponia andersonii]|uniref:Uncharacterized protein n=1 Tax=Parasponia andersonii TaxID=3476 RepID=A0A2P5AA53_PARAD|nr:hypothetical protein PanWU01x14_352920 [Parasponia andersonii]
MIGDPHNENIKKKFSFLGLRAQLSLPFPSLPFTWCKIQRRQQDVFITWSLIGLCFRPRLSFPLVQDSETATMCLLITAFAMITGGVCLRSFAAIITLAEKDLRHLFALLQSYYGCRCEFSLRYVVFSQFCTGEYYLTSRLFYCDPLAEAQLIESLFIVVSIANITMLLNGKNLPNILVKVSGTLEYN